MSMKERQTFMSTCSGAAHKTEPALVAVASLVPTSLLRPTSAILAMPSLSIKMLGDLRSKCAIFWPCKYSRPCRTSRATCAPLRRQPTGVDARRLWQTHVSLPENYLANRSGTDTLTERHLGIPEADLC